MDFHAENPLVDTEEELGHRKGIGKLRTQIVDDQQITVEKIGVGLLYIPIVPVASEGCFGKQVEELEGCQINDRMAAVHELFGDAVGKKGLSGAYGSQEKQVLKLPSKFSIKSRASMTLRRIRSRSLPSYQL